MALPRHPSDGRQTTLAGKSTAFEISSRQKRPHTMHPFGRFVAVRCGRCQLPTFRRIGATNGSRKPKAPLPRGLDEVPEEGLEPPTRGL